MKILLISMATLLSLSALIILFIAFYSGKPIKRLLLNGIFGILILIAINSTSKFTGVRIPVNPYSALGIGVFSIPCIIGLLLLNIIML